jgi:hypothetical protein
MQKIKEIRQGDLLAFIAGDNRYKALLCTSTYIEKSPQYYTFAALAYDNTEKPTEDGLRESEFFGADNTKNDHFNYSDQELDNMWAIYPTIKPNILGSYGFTIWRKDFMKFRDHFEYIGNLSIVNNLDKNGKGSMNASDWSFLKEFFCERYKTVLPDKGQQKFLVKSILRA